MALEDKDQDDIKILSLDELDRIDKISAQKANALIGQEVIKDLKNTDNLDDTPYVHNSTSGFGAGGFSPLQPLKIRSYKPYFIVAVIVAIIGLAIEYISTGNIQLDIFNSSL